MHISILLELIWLPLLSFLHDSFISLDLYQYPEVLHTDNDFNRSIVFTEQMVTLFVVSDAAFALKMTRWHQPTGPPAINYWHGKIECGPLHSFFLYNLSYTWRRKLGLAVYCTVYCTEYRTVYCTVYNTICTAVYVYLSVNCSIYFTVYRIVFVTIYVYCTINCPVYCTAYCTIYYSVCCSVHCTVYYSVFCTVYSILQFELDALFDRRRTSEQNALELKLAKSFKLEFGTAHAAKVSKSLRLKDLAAAQSASSKPANANLQSGKDKQAKRDDVTFPESFLHCQLDTLFDRRRTAEQLALELKLLKGFSSNIEGDGPFWLKRVRTHNNVSPLKRLKLAGPTLKFSFYKRKAGCELNNFLSKKQKILHNFSLAPAHIDFFISGLFQTYNGRIFNNKKIQVKKKESKFMKKCDQYAAQSTKTNIIKRYSRFKGQKPISHIITDTPLQFFEQVLRDTLHRILFKRQRPSMRKFRNTFKRNPNSCVNTIPVRPRGKNNFSSKRRRINATKIFCPLFSFNAFRTHSLCNNRRKSKKEQLKDGIFPKIND